MRTAASAVPACCPHDVRPRCTLRSLTQRVCALLRSHKPTLRPNSGHAVHATLSPCVQQFSCSAPGPLRRCAARCAANRSAQCATAMRICRALQCAVRRAQQCARGAAAWATALCVCEPSAPASSHRARRKRPAEPCTARIRDAYRQKPSMRGPPSSKASALRRCRQAQRSPETSSAPTATWQPPSRSFALCSVPKTCK